jgi:hypothetical protein
MNEALAFSDDKSVNAWYIKKFSGVVDPENAPAPTIPATSAISQIIDTAALDVPREKRVFWEAFRAVANNPAGRNLLYRILIERERGSVEDVIRKLGEDHEFDQSRHCALTLSVKWSDDTVHIMPFQGALFFNDETIIMQFCKALDWDHYEIGTMATNLDASLFHELLHWYHALRAPRRYYDEAFGFFLPIEQTVRQHPICQAIWDCDSDTTDDEILCSVKAWHTHTEDTGDYLDLEELRTIVGAKEQQSFFPDNEGFFISIFANGDELSENLYRRFAKLPYRFGYKAFNYYEDRAVVEHCVDFTALTALPKQHVTWDFLAKEAATWDCLMSAHRDSFNEKGIGEMRIPYRAITNVTKKGVIQTITDSVFRVISWVTDGVKALLM